MNKLLKCTMINREETFYSTNSSFPATDMMLTTGQTDSTVIARDQTETSTAPGMNISLHST